MVIGQTVTKLLVQPILSAQAVLPESQISIATASMLFFQYFGATFLNCIAKTVFLNVLGPALAEYAPDLDSQTVIGAGATEVLKVVAPKDVEGVKLAYNKALTTTFVSEVKTLLLIYRMIN